MNLDSSLDEDIESLMKSQMNRLRDLTNMKDQDVDGYP